MSRLRALPVFVACAALLVGCGHIDTYRYPLAAPGTAAPTGARPAIHFEGSTPAEGMQELAIVEAVGSGTKSGTGDVINAMQDEAMRWGANAIVRVRVDCGHGVCHGYGVAVRIAR